MSKYLVFAMVFLLILPIVNAQERDIDSENQAVLLKCYTQATYEAFDMGGKACGYITKRTQELAKDQNVTVYAGYIDLWDGRCHLAPVIKLSNGIYYGYEHQGNVLLSSNLEGRYDGRIMQDWVYQEVVKKGYPIGTVYIPDAYIAKHPHGKIYLRSTYIDDLPNCDVSFYGNLYQKIRTIHTHMNN